MNDVAFIRGLSKRIATMSTTGEQPGKGTYTCDNCGESVTLDDHDDTLPPCPRCHETEYTP
ncbi:zinc ribbon-containing protein [Idiomarina xiamenensis]